MKNITSIHNLYVFSFGFFYRHRACGLEALLL